MNDCPEDAGVLLAGEAATARFAEDIAAMLRPGDVVALSGGLGVGKTTFARALIRALANDPEREVPSPTFPLRIDHPLPRLTIVHADLYRLRSEADLDEVGLEDELETAAVLVEWPELLPPDMSANRLDIVFEIAGGGRRAIIAAGGTWPERLSRTRLARAFLSAFGWGDARRAPLVGDASVRAYERVSRDAETAILMNSPARQEGPLIYNGRSYDAVAHRALNVRAFIAIDVALREASIRAPEIYAADVESGLLLLENLGSEGILDSSGMPVIERYEAAIDLLALMHERTWPEAILVPDGGRYRLPAYDRGALLIEASLFPDWFGGEGEPEFPRDKREAFLAAWGETLDRIAGGPTTWVMRDFHSPNILWQADAAGTDRVGVLDFQDALIGDPAYDVASLAQDARAPLSEEQEFHLKARYIEARKSADLSFDLDRFETAYAVLAAQRATKVLGAFTRLALVEGKPGYQRHRARLKALLRRTLAHPVLSALRVWYEPYL
jgi:tRNA threonylcarbamoyl adenosine modification protein YjeE